MLALSSRPLRSLILATALAGATATAAAAPASAATGSHGSKPAKAAKAKAKAKKVKKAKRPAVAAGKPDLVARNLRLDFLADGFSIEAKVGNIGKGYAKKSDVSVVLSSDESFDAGDDVLDEIPVNGFAPGVERTLKTEVDIPEELPDGDLYLLVCADGNDAVTELKESNNCVSQLVASDSDSEDSADEGDDGEGSDQAAIDDADDGQTV